MAALGKYAKTISALVTGLIGWFATIVATEPGPVTSAEWIMLATVLATALGVYGVPNTPTVPGVDTERVERH